MSDFTLESAPEVPVLTFSCEAVKELHSTINYVNAFNPASSNIPAELNTKSSNPAALANLIKLADFFPYKVT